jgi:hypothetical protein
MNTKLQHGKDYEVVSWDWKGQPPSQECVELARKYQHYCPVDMGDDSHYALFSNTRFESNESAKKVVGDYLYSISEEVA